MKMIPLTPESFEILGHKIAVKVSTKTCESASADGLYNHEEKTILVKHKKGSHFEAAFYHEFVHCLLEHTGHAELSKDEELVDRLGEALYQSLKSFTA